MTVSAYADQADSLNADMNLRYLPVTNSSSMTWLDSTEGEPAWVDREHCWAGTWAWTLLAALEAWLIDFHWVWFLELPRVDAHVHDREAAIDIKLRDAWSEFSSWKEKILHVRMTLTDDFEDALRESHLRVVHDLEDFLWHVPLRYWDWFTEENVMCHEWWSRLSDVEQLGLSWPDLMVWEELVKLDLLVLDFIRDSGSMTMHKIIALTSSDASGISWTLPLSVPEYT